MFPGMENLPLANLVTWAGGMCTKKGDKINSKELKSNSASYDLLGSGQRQPLEVSSLEACFIPSNTNAVGAPHRISSIRVSLVAGQRPVKLCY